MMRWKTKPKKLPPTLRTTRLKIKLAWWPKSTDDGQTIWFENYLSVEEYCIDRNRLIDWREKERWSQASTMWNEWYIKI